MTLYLREDFEQAWKGKDPHTLLDSMDGEVFRELEARRTFRFEQNGLGYFAKVHRGVGWGEIFENLLRLRMPVLGARNEWAALQKLQALDLKTMVPVAYGERGCNPAKIHSFLVTEELRDMITLEDLGEEWKQTPPDCGLKRTIISKLATISRTLHDNGVNHRDYYLCHFMFNRNQLSKPESLDFYLIDLHRAQIRPQLPDRWRLKDISGLYFSAMEYGLTQRDSFRFIKTYTGLPLKEALKKYAKLWKKIESKAEKLQKRMERKAGHPNY
ncbi:heptose kinase [Endozoicomonas montiporae]|uniref:Lipopolysaccharide core heptose(I) kinase n=2 Tax=Endozoicomonas montiporae TaxID=1027273 RepID=A0A081MZH8_9GAMM|nr:lipopolysaccharide core heptose(I) kinase RfaP [Endozoicomonas montiporae]AMO54717.1 lipopolysaccharide core biosynthesis protein WaaP [Endozoicomonas montiporae CL-33]KEQ11601.1 heptose kinase [Endozoicomonas montiporae]